MNKEHQREEAGTGSMSGDSFAREQRMGSSERKEAGTGSMSGDSFAREQRMGSSKLQKSSGIQESGEIQESGGIASSRGMTDAPYSVKKNYGEDNAPQIQMGIQSRPSGSGSGVVYAFQLVKVAIDTLCVRQGTIGSTIPTITGGSELEADYTENELSLPGTGTREYWLKITIDSSGNITAVTIETSEPSADSATQAKLLLGSVETNSGDIVAFNSNLSGSQALASCGANHFFGVV